MPKLWDKTIEAHRREVRDVILDTTAALVRAHGLRSVTMSQIAEATGIGRATLYKYFSGVEPILVSWHDRHVARHFDYLVGVRDSAGDAGARVAAVLEAYAMIAYEHHDAELTSLVHRGEHFEHAQQHLHEFFRELLASEAARGAVRDDVAPDELANYCLHALAAVGSLPSADAVHRLVTVILAGLYPSR